MRGRKTFMANTHTHTLIHNSFSVALERVHGFKRTHTDTHAGRKIEQGEGARRRPPWQTCLALS